MHSITHFFDESSQIVADFDVWVAKFNPRAVADHICYKCESSLEFEQMRAMFEGESKFIYQSIISGRRIAIVAFKKPIVTALGEIRHLELSDQKPDGSQVSGFDHIEIYPVDGTMDELAAQIEASGFALEKVERPHHTTYDGRLGEHFKVRLEPEALITKIKAEEMG
jgi:predicted metalloenzyme YecM